MRASAPRVETLDTVDVECTFCHVAMTRHDGQNPTVRYFHCPSCHRWVTSMYSEVFTSDAKVRTRAPTGDTRTPFAMVRDRLEKWLKSLDRDDPYRLLGLTPADGPERIRERYLQLARQHHPDLGGNAEQMRALNDAYERVLEHQRTLQPVAGVSAART